MKENLLCVILAAPRHAGDVSDLMRMLRAMRDAADSLLLFCDLSDAFSSVLPEDDALIRSLQSGVMSLASRFPTKNIGVCSFLRRKPSPFRAAAPNPAQRCLPPVPAVCWVFSNRMKRRVGCSRSALTCRRFMMRLMSRHVR